MAMSLSRLIIGILLLVVGLVLLIASLYGTLFLLIYAVPALIIGIVILLNKKEDEIEERKDIKKRKSRK
jgi:membrane-bound ClpP family serine protease